jgi:hypothetical protein
MEKRFLILAFAMFFSLSLSAHHTKPLIRLMPLFVQGIGVEESRLIESLIQSYLSDVGDVISYIDFLGIEPSQAVLTDGAVPAMQGSPGTSFNIPDNFRLSEQETRLPDYTLTGSIYLERDSLIFMLKIGNSVSGETSSFTMTSKSIGELVLKARSLVETAFSSESEQMLLRESLPLNLNEAAIMGTWRGEPGIELIRFQRMGRGIVIFSSGAQMIISWAIADDFLKIKQISPNLERYYHPMPYEVAKQLTAKAEPMIWELQLYENGNTLRGLKTHTGVRYEGEQIIELLPNEMLNVEWIRSGR